MNGANTRCVRSVLAVVALAGAPACATCQAAAGGSSRDPHARALVLAMAQDANRHANGAASECRAVAWTVVRPVAPGVIDTTGQLQVQACRAGIPCREFYVDIREGHVADRPEWKGRAGRGSALGFSLPPLDLESIRAGLPRADAALLLVVAYEDATARAGERSPLLGNLKIDPWFDTETRIWRAEPARSEDRDLGCDRWAIDLRIGDVEVMRWTVDLSVDSVSRST